jgi:hypothetical protein
MDEIETDRERGNGLAQSFRREREDWIKSVTYTRFDVADVCWSSIQKAPLDKFGLRGDADSNLIYKSREFAVLGWIISPTLTCNVSRSDKNFKIQITEVGVAEIASLISWFSLNGVIEISPSRAGIRVEQRLQVSLTRQGPLRYLPKAKVERILESTAVKLGERVSLAIRRRMASWSSGRD